MPGGEATLFFLDQLEALVVFLLQSAQRILGSQLLHGVVPAHQPLVGLFHQGRVVAKASHLYQGLITFRDRFVILLARRYFGEFLECRIALLLASEGVVKLRLRREPIAGKTAISSLVLDGLQCVKLPLGLLGILQLDVHT